MFSLLDISVIIKLSGLNISLFIGFAVGGEKLPRCLNFDCSRAADYATIHVLPYMYFCSITIDLHRPHSKQDKHKSFFSAFRNPGCCSAVMEFHRAPSVFCFSISLLSCFSDYSHVKVISVQHT